MNRLFSGPLRAPEDPASSGAPRRASSVTFQQNPAAGDDASMLDPANQSLADALKVMMWLLQGGMAVLAGLYLLSGIQTVKEGEQGIRLLFGRKQSTTLDPGATWTAPYPLGQLIKVGQGEQAISIDREFWQYVDAGGDPSPEKLVPKVSLKPFEGNTGSVLTADGNIAHTRWRVAYSRADAAKYAQNVLSVEEEQKLVRAAVKRGIVHAAAQVGIEEMLRQGSGQEGGIARTAKQVAQRALDACSSGLQIDQLDPLDTIPPTYVKADFAKVQSAESDAGKARENAQAEANQRLLETAGQVSPYLIRHLDLYEVATSRRGAAMAAGAKADALAAENEMKRLLGEIDAMLLGQPVEVAAGTVMIGGESRPLAAGKIESLSGGRVADTLSSARSYRTGVVSKARTDLARFQARLSQFEANPGVTLYREWSQSVAAFMGRDSVQYFLFPGNLGVLNLNLNPDPDIVREQEKLRKQRDRDDAEHRRLQEFDKSKFNTQTGQQPVTSG